MIPVLPALLLAVPAPPTPASPQEEVRPFDGETLDGWSGTARFWSVEDGVLVGRSTPETRCDATTYLTYDGGRFDDFELTFEYWIDGGNSGVQFRSAVDDAGRVSGYQADIEDGPNWTGCIYEQDGRGVLVRRGTRVDTDGVTRTAAPLADTEGLDALGAPRAWHTYTVRAIGPDVELILDGRTTAKLTDHAPAARRSGAIALQLHQGPPMEVRYRNIVVRPIQADAAAAPATTLPRWIWHPDGEDEAQAARLTRTLEAGVGLERATVFATCDNAVELSLDGELFAGGSEWTEPFEVDVTERLADGAAHTLVAECWNEGGPAGFAARITLHYADGRTETIVSDAAWTLPDGRPAAELATWGDAPWGVPAGRSSGSPDATIAPEALELPPGFTAELLYRVPRHMGSWVALTVDDEGRLIAAAEARTGLFRLTPNEGGTPSVEHLDIDVQGAQGLLALGDDLYVMRNEWDGGQNGLWRARDTNGDDAYDTLELLQALDGGGEHGPHAIRLTPDGTRLQVICGNQVALPTLSSTHVATNWSEDQVLPSLPDTFGHGNAMHLHGGWTATCNLDGKNWELVACGMRNAYDLAYDAAGNAFTFDSDMEWDMGAPWYRAPRVLHLFPGAEYGWRRGSGKIPADAPETVGGVCDTGPASPVGVLHGKDGGFHPPFAKRLFIGDWTRGRVLAVELEPDEDTFRGTPKPFVTGRPFPVTDMEWLPDGSMVIAIGGRGGRSALYRIASTVGAAADAGVGTNDPEEFFPDGARARTERRAAFESNPDIGRWAGFVLRDRYAEGLLALARVGGKEWQGRLLKSVIDKHGTWDRTFVRVIALSVARDGEPDARWTDPIVARLASEFPSGDPNEDVERIELLVRLGSADAPALGVPAMENAATQEAAIDYALALSWAETGWSDALARRYLDFLHTDARSFRGGRSVEGYLDRIRTAALSRAGRAVDGGYTPPKSPAAPARTVEATFFVQAWEADDLVPLLDDLDAAFDPVLGERAFERASCFTCHRVGGVGAGTGPDLTDAGARFTSRDLLTALLEPSKDVSDQYRDTEIWTTDGEVFVGRPVEATESGWVALHEANADSSEGSIIEIPEDEVATRRPSPLSRMPTGLLDVLTKDEVRALLAWVLADKR